MSRDDSILISGMSSEASTKVRQEQKDRENKAETEKSDVIKHAESLYELISQERERFQSIDKLDLLPTDTDATLTTEIKARQQHLEFLRAFETRVRQILGER